MMNVDHKFMYMQLGQNALKDDLDVGDESNKYLGRKLERRHVCLRRVDIMGFCASKSLVELTIHILENTPSLERVTLDTIYGYNRCSGTFRKCSTSTKIILCSPLSKTDLVGARRAVKVAGRYIVGRVPSSVQLEVLDPCNRCNTGDR